MDREAWRATIHRVAKSLTRLVSLMAQTVKNLPAMKETWVRSLGWEDPRRRKWQPTPVFLPGEFYGQRSLAGYSPYGHKELDMTEQLSLHFICHWASLVAQTGKNLPAMPETWVQSLGQEDPLEEVMATHSSILAWRITWTEESGRLHTPWGHKESQRDGHD